MRAQVGAQLAGQPADRVGGFELAARRERLDPARPLSQLGLDSLMATEVATTIRRRFGCLIPALEVIGADGIAHLARLVYARLARD
ncbi:acyl carrier protein [Herbidospora yilanensis]|uniref:acyl carrier protein n=1 Tax=Herbidospora yilanensis TaxID=354426 RepID=UPI000A7F1237|nr:acyl carrier protein [Herbidospora yilanensis]